MADNSESGCGSLLLVGAIFFGVHYYSSSNADEKAVREQAVISGEAAKPGMFDSAIGSVNPIRPDFSEDRAQDAAQVYVSTLTYESAVGGAQCDGDCSGHEAGWQWAKDGNSCGSGDSPSFDEGCEAYESAVEERVDEARSRYNDGDDTFAGEDS